MMGGEETIMETTMETAEEIRARARAESFRGMEIE